MAFGRNPDRTLLVQVGSVKAFSDVAGRHVIRLSDSAENRKDVAERLRTAGCAVSTLGSDWLHQGNFSARERVVMSGPADRSSDEGTMKQVVESMEKKMIMEALVSADWVEAKAAEAIGISERMLRYKMKKLRIVR
jgi:DNA-binding NtrC family response regulator